MGYVLQSIRLSINAKAFTEYKIAGTNIVTKSIHKIFGIVMSDDLSWNQHYDKMIPKAYRNAGAASVQLQPVSICFCQVPIFGKISSYLLLNHLETNSYHSCWTNPKESNKVYYTSSKLKKLNLLPLMYIFELKGALYSLYKVFQSYD